MMMAAEFSRSAIARHSDFTTSAGERGVFTLREKGNVRIFLALDPKQTDSSNIGISRLDAREPSEAA